MESSSSKKGWKTILLKKDAEENWLASLSCPIHLLDVKRNKHETAVSYDANEEQDS